jgi:hypothetical protein
MNTGVFIDGMQTNKSAFRQTECFRAYSGSLGS